MPYGHKHLTWRGDTLHCGSLAIRIEPDSAYPSMWRIRLPDGELSDMVNRTRTRDAARAIMLSQINDRACKKAA